MATTNSWSSGTGTGNFLDGTNWSSGIAPAAGQFDIVGYGEPVLQDASVNGFTIDIVSQTTLEAELDIVDATLQSGMLIEDTNSTNGQSMLIAGQVTNDGTFLLDASVGGIFNGFTLNFTGNTDTLTNNGAITIAGSDGLFVGNGNGGTLVNDGLINVGGTRLFLNSPIVGSGTIAIDNTTLDVTSSISVSQTIAFVDDTSTAAFASGRLGLDVGGSEGTVDGFVAGDTLDFPLLSFDRTGSGYNPATRELTLVTSNGTLTFHLGGSIPYADGSFFDNPDTSEGFQITTTTTACFVAGTRLLTVSGDVAVEALAPGDLLVTVSGQARPVRWIGHRHVDCTRQPKPEDVWPVRVCADAFAIGQPHHDLLLSPDHAVFIDGALIPIRYLINGRSIVQEQVHEETYYHVELASHDVILAEGLPCESYLDTGNRSAFANGGDEVMLHPNFALTMWETKACAELVLDGPRLAAAKSVVLRQAGTFGYRLSNDPDLAVVVDGRTMSSGIAGKTWRVRLPPTAGSARLVSRTWVPAHTRANENDTRSLGIAISNLHLDGMPVRLDDPRLSSGWLAPETDWRWTGGDAGLLVAGVRELTFDVVMTGSYWEAPEEFEKVRAD